MALFAANENSKQEYAEMKIAVFGGTGFIGSYICDALIENGHTPRLLVREGSEGKIEQAEQCEAVTGAVGNADAVRETISGCDAVIYSIGLIREFPRKGITYEETHFKGVENCIAAAKKENVRRFILMSALGVRPNGTAYQFTKHLGEQALKQSGLDWIILRPSTVFGNPRGRKEFCTMLKAQMLSLPIPAPLFFSGLIPKDAGSFEFSPIHVKDVASITIKLLSKKEGWNTTLELGGPESFTWKEMIKIIGKSYGKNKWTMPAPAWGIKSAATALDRFSWFPVTRDQVTMLMEGAVCDTSSIFSEFGITPSNFSAESLSYLQPKPA